MRFTVERRALIKMLQIVGKPDPSLSAKDQTVRVFACVARVFVEANHSTAGVEALVFEDGSCVLDHKVFLRGLKAYVGKKNITIEANERCVQFGNSTRPVSGYRPTVEPPAKFREFPATSGWLTFGGSTESRLESAGVSLLPNADKAVVEREKITEYLLNRNHRIGASKARFFAAFDFTPAKWEVFAEALREHARSHPVASMTLTEFGPRYEVEGELNTPSGRNPIIRTVWQIDDDNVEPRLITAYPTDGR